MNSFEVRNSQGLRGQEVVKAHLESRGHKVIDVSQDKDYQKKDIDFLLTSANGVTTTLEVKTDKHLFTTGNIFLEVGSVRGNNYKAGWIKYCEAEYLAVYDSKMKHGIILDLPQLVSFLATGFDARKYTKEFFDKEDNKKTVAILYPVEEARKNNFIKYEWIEGGC